MTTKKSTQTGNEFAVIGAGSWGTALALLLARKQTKVNLWVFEPELVNIIKSTRENEYFLPGIKLPDNIYPSNNLEEVLRNTKFIVIVTPSQTVREVLIKARSFIQPGSILIGASKGIENGSLLRVSEIVKEILDENLNIKYLVLSGPTFASGVANSLPSSAVVAGSDLEAAKLAQKAFTDSNFRVYVNQDIIGVELGGALKNVIAIASGIVAGLKLGSNSKAALITRGLWEIYRLGNALGAKQITFQGLSGMGDLVLTCDGTESRNFQVGYRIGQGESLSSIQKNMRMVAEGVKTTLSVIELAKKHNVEMPIAQQVYETLYNRKSPRQAVMDLMTRTLKSEHQTDI